MPQRILLVDDDPEIRQGLRELLITTTDCEVVTASCFEEGRQRGKEGSWDIVISDEQMPDGRGSDLLAELSRERPETHHVLMSGFSDFEMLLRGINAAHIDHFIQKPYDPLHVVEWVQRTLRDRAHLAVYRRASVGPFRRIMGGLRTGGPSQAPSQAPSPAPSPSPALILPPSLHAAPVAVAPARAASRPAAPARGLLPPAPARSAPLTPRPAPPPSAPPAAALPPPDALPAAPALLPPPEAPPAPPAAPDLLVPVPASAPPEAAPHPAPPALAPPAPPAAPPFAEPSPGLSAALHRTVSDGLTDIALLIRFAEEATMPEEKLRHVRMATRRMEDTARNLEALASGRRPPPPPPAP